MTQPTQALPSLPVQGQAQAQSQAVLPLGPAPGPRFTAAQWMLGLATPDDSMTFEDCQAGYGSRLTGWQQGYMRGMELLQQGGNRYADELGVRPSSSVCGPFDVQDETIFHSLYREWLRLLCRGLGPGSAA